MAGWRKRYRGYEARRRAFLSALDDGASVTAACRQAGLGRRGVYAARRRDPAFAAGWDEALARRRAAARGAFLEALAQCGEVLAACRRCGQSPMTLGEARRREPGFARAWARCVRRAEAAREAAAERRIAARRRALLADGGAPRAAAALSDAALGRALAPGRHVAAGRQARAGAATPRHLIPRVIENDPRIALMRRAGCAPQRR